MKGKMVSFVESKNFGFATGDDGESYFVHGSALCDKTQRSKLGKGAIISFEPHPTPKGLRANNVQINTELTGQKLVEFFTTKSSEPKHGKVLSRENFSTSFFKDPNVGRKRIIDLAQKAGANAILNLNFEKHTFSEGNYRYTMHAFSGQFAVVSETVPFTNESDKIQHQAVIDNVRNALSGETAKLQAPERFAREEQLKSGPGGGEVMAVILALAVVGSILVAILS
ncbi:cold shock domain-containing protein [Neiella marina]|uniref:Cold shock domain-containing protein n=1 Tax=Neiella holothuriorum TaxID=2870530 RepID=A0ABS7EG68_9GAMM|nr:cold shock domain-containing protein [Neiella holothuriorum]MBW8191346.1 cold shock domain-containing protein [Neiella holothuriorum]